jgi:hypothetical protein
MRLRPPRPLAALFALAAALPATVHAQAAPGQAAPALVVGQGSAWVREFFGPSGEADVQRLVWTHPPPNLDLDSLQVWSVRRPWPIRQWRWMPRETDAETDAGPVRWSPRDVADAAPPARERLEILLDRPLSHRMGHSLTYRLEGFDWSVSYRIVVRGGGPDALSPVQIDLAAVLRIRNDTARSIAGARISLAGSGTAPEPSPKPFGRLELNPDSPLADLWMARSRPSPPVPRIYPLNVLADVPAMDSVELPFANARRQPATLVHWCDSNHVPSPTQPGGLPLERRLLIPNRAEAGLGFALPPGKADIFQEAFHDAPAQSGNLHPVAFPGEVVVSMDANPAVRATRHADEPVPLAEGVWQVDHSVALDNDLDSAVQVRVVERPLTPFKWDLVRSSVPGSVGSDAIEFDVRVPPRSSRLLTYRLRLARTTG